MSARHAHRGRSARRVRRAAHWRTTSNAEGRFLLACAAAALAAKKQPIAPIDSRGLDWSKIIHLAKANRVVPLLAAAAIAGRVASLPQPIADELRASCRAGMLRNMNFAGELNRVLQALMAAGIRCIPLKGAVLAAGSYGNLAVRDFDDLDLLVAPADAARAAAVLCALGYDGWDIPEHRLASHLASECEQTLIRRGGGGSIDLHWAIYRRYFTVPMDFDEIWRRTRRIQLLGSSVPDLSAEDAVLFLCFHGAKHVFHRLAWVCDIAAAIAAHPHLNWDMLLETAARHGARRLVLLGLLLAERLMGTRIPQPVRKLIRADSTLYLLASESIGVIFQNKLAASKMMGQIQASLFHLRLRERLADRFRYLFWALVPNARDWNDSSLPAAFGFLHMLSRPVRLMRKNLAASTSALRLFQLPNKCP